MQHNAKSTPESIEACRAFMRVRRLSLRTEDSCLHYIRRFLGFIKCRPEIVGEAEVEAFLTHLVVEDRIAKATQSVAFSAVMFLLREVLGIELEGVHALRSQRPKRVPVVLSKSEEWRAKPTLTRTCRRTRSVTRSPRICSKRATTFAPFKICSATKMFAPRNFICTP